MDIPIDGTYSVPVGGPSPHLMMLRAVLLKAAGIARNAWHGTRTTVRLAGQLPRSAAVSVASLLATNAGYAALTGTVRTILRAAWNGIRAVAKGIGQVGRTTAGLVTLAVGYVSAPGADWTLRITDTMADAVTGVARSMDAAVRGAGELAWALAHTTLVRTAVTVAASTASAVFVTHTLTQGLLAVRIVQAAPALMTLVVWATDPWRTLGLVAVVAAAAMGIALARLIKADQSEEDWEPEPPTPAATMRPVQPAPDPAETPAVMPMIDWDAVAASVRIEITNDGSVVVRGIPNSIPTGYGEVIAQIATDAALKHWRRTRTSRPCPSRDDRRLFTKAAKEAVRNHARNQAA